jgi:hypothetical protein
MSQRNEAVVEDRSRIARAQRGDEAERDTMTG